MRSVDSQPGITQQSCEDQALSHTLLRTCRAHLLSSDDVSEQVVARGGDRARPDPQHPPCNGRLVPTTLLLSKRLCPARDTLLLGRNCSVSAWNSPARSSFVEQLENSSHLKIALIPTRHIADTITHLEPVVERRAAVNISDVHAGWLQGKELKGKGPSTKGLCLLSPRTPLGVNRTITATKGPLCGAVEWGGGGSAGRG